MINYSQEIVFIFFFIIGWIVGIIYDFFRILRKNIKTSNTVTLIEDIIFIIICLVLILFGIIKLNNGIIRFYLFIGLFFGILIYFLTISRLCVIILSVIVRSFIYFVEILSGMVKKVFKFFRYYIKRFFKIFIE